MNPSKLGPGLRYFLKNNKVKFLKTHNALISIDNHDFTYPQYVLGIIHIVRDPRNIITSLKNHLSFRTYEECLKFMVDYNSINRRGSNPEKPQLKHIFTMLVANYHLYP